MLTIDHSLLGIVRSAIVISGSGRSGTTLLGKIVNSFKGTEYLFEPPTLISLFALTEVLDENHWRFLYESYLGDDFLVNALAGRAINLNNHDDSCLFKVKSGEEIQRRLGRSWSKHDMLQELTGKAVAYKIPNIVPYLSKFANRYPSSRVVIVKRQPAQTIRSLLRKGWFSDSGAQRLVASPFREIGHLRVPYWLPQGQEAWWGSLRELDRCAYYYLFMSNAPLEGQNIRYISYEDLVSQPEPVVWGLADWLGAKFGDRTHDIIASVKGNQRESDASILDDVCDEFRDLLVRMQHST